MKVLLSDGERRGTSSTEGFRETAHPGGSSVLLHDSESTSALTSVCALMQRVWTLRGRYWGPQEPSVYDCSALLFSEVNVRLLLA